MNKEDQEQIKSMLNTLTHVSYTALAEVHKLKGEFDADKEKELKTYKENLIMRIEELFTSA